MESFPLPPKKSLGYVAAGIAQVECTRRCFRFQELIEHVCKTKVCTIWKKHSYFSSSKEDLGNYERRVLKQLVRQSTILQMNTVLPIITMDKMEND